MENKRRIVVALGGNALIERNGLNTAEEQERISAKSAEKLVGLILQGHEVVLVHGNGPQVGSIVLQQHAANSEKTPAMPLDVCGAMSEGMIGYWLQQAMDTALTRAKVNKRCATVIAQTVVSAEDTAFQNPTKPIGPFYTEAEAQAVAASQGYVMKEDAGRGWRRVVPSPEPLEILEIDLIQGLLERGSVVVTAGGGGIPVIRQEDGALHGVEAVIDKDLAAARLASQIDADVLLILTDVSAVAVDYRKESQRDLGEVTTGELQTFMQQGQFAPGSMLPKVSAAIRFVEAREQRTAVITSIDKALDGLAGREGTRIHS